MRIDSDLINELKCHIPAKYASIQYIDKGESVIKFKGLHNAKDVLIRIYSRDDPIYFGDSYMQEKLCLTSLKGVISNHFVFPDIIEEFEIVNKGILYDCLVLSWLLGRVLGEISLMTPYLEEWDEIMLEMGKEFKDKYHNYIFYEDNILNHLLSLGLNSEVMDKGDEKSINVLSKLLTDYYDLIPKTVEYLKEIDRDSAPVMIHGDLHSRNIVIRDNTVSEFGIIDWEYAGIGHLKSIDLSYLQYSEFIGGNNDLNIDQITKLLSINDEQEIRLAVALHIHWGITELQRSLLMDQSLNPESIVLIEKHLQIYKIINGLIP